MSELLPFVVSTTSTYCTVVPLLTRLYQGAKWGSCIAVLGIDFQWNILIIFSETLSSQSCDRGDATPVTPNALFSSLCLSRK